MRIPVHGLMLTSSILVLCACGSHSTPTAPVETASSPVASSPPKPPPPSPEEPFGNALDSIGTSNTYRGPMAVFPTVKPSKGKWQLSTTDNERLDKIAELLRQNPETNLIIEGYTDTVGARQANERLSLEHAKIFQNALVKERGIAPERIRAKGRGEENPAADTSDPDAHVKNQRVQIVFSSRDGEFAAATDRPEAAGDQVKG